MNERIIELRKYFHMTQREFGDRIGVAPNTLSRYESGDREPSNAVITAICRVYNVNETWLRSGLGEMFAAGEDDLYAEITRALGPNCTRLARALLRLLEICTEEEALNIINECLDTLDKPVTIPASEYARLKEIEKKEQRSTDSLEDIG
jgi:transcriptional regulator with XRE-family HTH domain